MYRSMLREYVLNIIARTIADKEQRGIFPACCLRTDIMSELSDDVTEIMRQLHIEGVYRGSKNKNGTPMLLKRNQE